MHSRRPPAVARYVFFAAGIARNSFFNGTADECDQAVS